MYALRQVFVDDIGNDLSYYFSRPRERAVIKMFLAWTREVSISMGYPYSHSIVEGGLEEIS